MKTFKIKGLPPTVLYSEEPGYCSVVDTGAYSMNDKKDPNYVYWKIINNGNRPFLWIESPKKIFAIIRDLLEEGCYDYTIGKDPELGRNFSKVISKNVIICIKFPEIDTVRNMPELIPRFEWVMSFLYSILENAKKIYKRALNDYYGLGDETLDALKTEIEDAISDGAKRKCKEIKNIKTLEQALNAYLGLYPDGGDNHITNIDDDTTIYTSTGMCEHKITIIMKNFDEEDSLHDER